MSTAHQDPSPSVFLRSEKNSRLRRKLIAVPTTRAKNGWPNTSPKTRADRVKIAVGTIGLSMARFSFTSAANRSAVIMVILQNDDVLPPGQGRAVAVDVVGFMPVGRDVFCICLCCFVNWLAEIFGSISDYSESRFGRSIQSLYHRRFVKRSEQEVLSFFFGIENWWGLRWTREISSMVSILRIHAIFPKCYGRPKIRYYKESDYEYRLF